MNITLKLLNGPDDGEELEVTLSASVVPAHIIRKDAVYRHIANNLGVHIYEYVGEQASPQPMKTS